MAIPAYMWIKDEEGNLIKSSSKVSGREESVEVLGFQHKVYMPSDRDSGFLTGTRKHEPFIVSKQFCSASPILYKACCAGKTLKELKLSWYRINDTGNEEEYFRHIISEVKVVSVIPRLFNVKDKDYDAFGQIEDVHFRYKKIEWLFLEGNIASSDQWTQRA